MSEPPKRPRGRPKGGRTWLREAHAYLDEEGARRLDALKARTGMGTSEVIRQALRELARREKLE